MIGEEPTKPPTWKVLLAFATIYLVWGSTFLAIRVGVREVPPFLLAAMRCLIAGAVLYGWTRARGTPPPAPREWGGATLIALLIFVLNYGLVFWAEQRVPSGVTAVMMASIPAFMALSEIFILGTQRMNAHLGAALLLGIGGVAVLVTRLASFREVPIDTAGACALLVAAISWSVASALTRKLPLPEAKAMSSGAQMLTGGALLTLTSAALGEFRSFHIMAVSRSAWLALGYMTVAGSLIAYTAYVWLLHHESPTKVGTYAYVNPVIAVLLGYFLAGEALGPRTILGTLLVLVSVVLITTAPAKKKMVAEWPGREREAES